VLVTTSTRLLQVGIIALGLVLAAAMVVLGLWQGRVYAEQGEQANAARVAEPPLVLTEVAPPAEEVRDGFGRSVTFTGTYVPDSQLLVPVAGTGSYRVLTALLQTDGSAVPVVRGEVPGPTAPPPPTGIVSQVGVLAPSEASSPPGALPPDQIAAIELATLAQRWSWPLIGGYVTLDARNATAQGLVPTTAVLPRSDGRLRNAAYAVQWWIFAAFAIGMGVRMARDVGRRDLLEQADHLEPDDAVADRAYAEDRR